MQRKFVFKTLVAPSGGANISKDPHSLQIVMKIVLIKYWPHTYFVFIYFADHD